MIIQPIVLEGTAVRLEPMHSGHLDVLCEIGLEESLWAFTPSQLRTRDDIRTYIESALEEQRLGRALPFVTVERGSGRVVGSTRFGSIERTHRRVEIGWTWVAVRWQRSIVNTEAKFLMLRHAFETWKCIRVELKTDRLNERSRRALARIGACEEGILRNHMITSTGRFRDTVYYSIIDAEWPEVKRRLADMMRPR